MIESVEEMQLRKSFMELYLAVFEGNVKRVLNVGDYVKNQIGMGNGMPKGQKATIIELLEQASEDVYARGIGFTLEKVLQQAEKGYLLEVARKTILEARQYAEKSNQEFPYSLLHRIHSTLYNKADIDAKKSKKNAEEDQRESGINMWQKYLRELPQKRLQDALTYATWAIRDKKPGEVAYWLKDIAYSAIMRSFAKVGPYKPDEKAA